MSTENAINHLDAAIKALCLEAYRADDPADLSALEHFTIAEDLKRIDSAIGTKGASIFARIADSIQEAYIEILVAREALAKAPPPQTQPGGLVELNCGSEQHLPKHSPVLGGDFETGHVNNVVGQTHLRNYLPRGLDGIIVGVVEVGKLSSLRIFPEDTALSDMEVVPRHSASIEPMDHNSNIRSGFSPSPPPRAGGDNYKLLLSSPSGRRNPSQNRRTTLFRILKRRGRKIRLLLRASASIISITTNHRTNRITTSRSPGRKKYIATGASKTVTRPARILHILGHPSLGRDLSNLAKFTTLPKVVNHRFILVPMLGNNPPPQMRDAL
ncbi:hypothetical protein [Neorhizobium galegae]|uniref:hypothetical protein n=1 Tax=Neorhizobium galegae TaxID=399 RepID=UPI00177F9FE6|nr:hypothetical protein [Neorhizobium galegae]